MTVRRLHPRNSRLAALALLVLACVLAYFVLLHWWFVAPMQQIQASMAQARDTHARYEVAIAQKPALMKRIALLGAGQAASHAFLADDDPNTAAADLMQKVVDVVGQDASRGRCAVSQKMPIPSASTSPGEPYQKAAVSISLSCDIEPLAAVLYALEKGTPYLFIDDLSIYRNPVAAQRNGAPLEVQFTLSGYVHPRRQKTATAAVSSPPAAGDEP